jgi:hypothetical protein
LLLPEAKTSLQALELGSEQSNVRFTRLAVAISVTCARRGEAFAKGPP